MLLLMWLGWWECQWTVNLLFEQLGGNFLVFDSHRYVHGLQVVVILYDVREFDASPCAAFEDRDDIRLFSPPYSYEVVDVSS